MSLIHTVKIPSKGLCIVPDSRHRRMTGAMKRRVRLFTAVHNARFNERKDTA